MASSIETILDARFDDKMYCLTASKKKLQILLKTTKTKQFHGMPSSDLTKAPPNH